MTELRFTATHVDDLAGRQRQAAAQCSAAAAVADGAGRSVWLSHGVICAPSAVAVAAVADARRAACDGMNAVSADLSRKLAVAVRRYEAVDEAGGARLDRRMLFC